MTNELIKEMLIKNFGPGFAATATVASHKILSQFKEGHSEDLELAYAFVIARDIQPGLNPLAKEIFNKVDNDMAALVFDAKLGQDLRELQGEVIEVVYMKEMLTRGSMITEAEKIVEEFNS